MRIGYARVSTVEQNPALQQDALRAAGCDRVFEDKASGAKASAERPGLAAALEYARPGDTLVVWRLDRLGRSLKDPIDRVQELEARGIDFRSLRAGFDTTTGSRRLVFHVFGVLAEFERALIRERTSAGWPRQEPGAGRAAGNGRSPPPKSSRCACWRGTQHHRRTDLRPLRRVAQHPLPARTRETARAAGESAEE